MIIATACGTAPQHVRQAGKLGSCLLPKRKWEIGIIDEVHMVKS
jgi:hypothetical protein